MEPDNWLVSAGLVTSSVIAITANSLLLLVFCRKRSLRTVPNRFVINLLVTNLLSSILLIPLLIADQQTQPVPFQNSTSSSSNGSVEIEKVFIREEIVSTKFETGDLTDVTNTSDLEIIETSQRLSLVRINATTNERSLLCYSAQSGTSFVCTLSILSILLIGINQYFGVIHSLRYHFYINKCRSSLFILTTWLVAFLFGLLSCVTHNDGTLWRFCKKRKNSETIRIFNTIYAFSYFVVVILAPFVAICVIYVCIYAAAHKNSERMRKSNSANLDNYIQTAGEEKTMIKVQSAPNFSRLEENEDKEETKKTNRIKVTRTSSERHTFITSLKHKISNATVFKYREETRAAKISVLVIFLVLICYIPYGLTLVLNSELVHFETSRRFSYLSLVLLVFSNIISPFLFAYRNKRVKREMGKVFGVAPPRSPNCPTTRRQSNDTNNPKEPFLAVPEVIVTCKIENERKSILKRVCDTSGWTNCKKCNFITVPECVSAEGRGSFSSASTQISNDD